MVCRHKAGDPECTSRSYYQSQDNSPKADQYEIVDIARVNNHVILKVLYPNCANCSYEGNKVMVFLNVTEVDILKWKKIDPHFRPNKPDPKEAPSPAARFPASKEGWQDAIDYAKSKN